MQRATSLSILLQLDAIDIGKKKNTSSFSGLLMAKVKPSGLGYIDIHCI